MKQGIHMGLFFNADKYIVRVESPRVNASKPYKMQILLYLDKYFEMYEHEYLEGVHTACRSYLDEVLDEESTPVKQGSFSEIQAVTTIIKGLQDYIDQKKHEELRYEKLLAARQAFKLYCGMISKMLEYDIIDRKQAKRRITKFYKEAGLD